MDSTLSSYKIRRKAEAATIIQMLRKRTTRNVPLAIFNLTLAHFFIYQTVCFGAKPIGMHDYVPVHGLVTLALALFFVYAASVNLFVRASDRVLLLLTEEIFKHDSEAQVITMLNTVQNSHAKRKVEAVGGNGGQAP